MTQFLLVFAVALTVGAIVFGTIALLSGDDEGLSRAEPDGRAVPLPTSRPLTESDVADTRFDPVLRGYRMRQVDTALSRVAYDIGYKNELVKVLQAEIDALREGRFPDAEVLRRAREAALAHVQEGVPEADTSGDRAAEETAAEETAAEETAAEETSEDTADAAAPEASPDSPADADSPAPDTAPIAAPAAAPAAAPTAAPTRQG